MGKFSPENLYKRHISIAIHWILRVLPKLMSVSLSGPYCCEDLKMKLNGNIKKSLRKNPAYRHSFMRWGKGYFFKICCDPLDSLRPDCSLVVVFRDSTSTENKKQVLSTLDEMLPELKLSKLRYGIDLICDSPEEVETLYKLLNDNIFVPQRKIRKKTWADVAVYEDEDRSNNVSFVGSKRRILERGPENKKKADGSWPYEVIDRVRLEYTCDGNTLRKREFYTICDLINDSHFLSVIEGKWIFKRFTSPKFKKPWEYETGGPDPECFLSIYHKMKTSIPNVSKYTERIPEFSELENRIKIEARKFDEQWKAA